MVDYTQYITIEPDKRYGQPCIRGMQITVYDILNMLAANISMKEIVDDFPDLTHEDILACLAYAGDRGRRQSSAIRFPVRKA